jgi:hypothetical protein
VVRKPIQGEKIVVYRGTVMPADIEQIKTIFIEKFRADKRLFGEKLKSIGIARATWADLRHSRRKPKKKTIEAMKAYVENRPTKYASIDASKEFYCCDCEKVRPLTEQSDRWSCTKCENIRKYRHDKKYWPRVLARKANLRLKYKYGTMASCMRGVLEIKKELKKYGKDDIR